VRWPCNPHPHPTTPHPAPTSVHYPHRQMAPNCACIAVSPFTRHMSHLYAPQHTHSVLEATVPQYFRYFKLTTLRCSGPCSMTILLSYLSTIKPHTPVHSTALHILWTKTKLSLGFFVEPGLRMRFQQPERYVRKLAFFFCFSFPIFGPL